MANIQKYFEQFNERIRTGYKYNFELKDKRDTLISNLKDHLHLDFDHFNQGSYGMGTGVKPEDGDFDIDVGIIFKESDNNVFNCPYDIKNKVYMALQHQNRTVKIKRPCVTVQYTSGEKDKYHVDFAIYKEDKSGRIHFARGKSPNDEELRWELAEPKDLVNKIKNKFTNDAEKAQYKRCIRVLKRWRSNRLNHKNLPSIAITVAAYYDFEPSFYNNEKDNPNDVEALIKFLTKLDSAIYHKNILLPTSPYSNLLGNLTDAQAKDLRAKLRKLKDDLEEIRNENKRVEDACKKMRKHFGQDFPVPENTNLSTEEFIEDKFALSKEMESLNLSLRISNYNSLIYSVISRYDRSLKLIPKGRELVFRVENVDNFIGCDFYWKVLNVGEEADRRGIRGQIEKGSTFKKEHSDFNGEHYVECYVIKGETCIARETIDVPI